MIDILSLTLDDLVRILSIEFGKGKFHGEALFREFFKRGNVYEWTKADEFVRSLNFTERLAKSIYFHPGQVMKVFNEKNLLKFITRLEDGLLIESVIIPMSLYNTLCVSSQIGCKMGCQFCETGKIGFKRNLNVSEITGQLFNARHILKKRIKNIVFMGMGEPLDNFDNVMKAVLVMNQQKGFDIALRHITLSTAGLVPGINRLASMGLDKLRLAISVNAVGDETRSVLMPINRTWPLAELKAALSRFPLSKRGSFLFEYILIRGMNDSIDHVHLLSDFIHPLPVRLNLIPLNPISGFHAQSPSDEELGIFADALIKKGVFVIKRWSKGRSVSAGCGQLGKNFT